MGDKNTDNFLASMTFASGEIDCNCDVRLLLMRFYYDVLSSLLAIVFCFHTKALCVIRGFFSLHRNAIAAHLYHPTYERLSESI
jgi:hypothetical protein